LHKTRNLPFPHPPLPIWKAACCFVPLNGGSAGRQVPCLPALPRGNPGAVSDSVEPDPAKNLLGFEPVPAHILFLAE
jgi:hypothetical protein